MEVRLFLNCMVRFIQPCGIFATLWLIGIRNFFEYIILLNSIMFSFLSMEYFIRYSHKYLWHGPLWFLHAPHHAKPSNDQVDENDILGMGNAVWIMAMMAYWSQYPESKYFVQIGGYFIGVILYGTLVLYLHDGLSHNRFSTVPIFFKKKLRKEAALHLRHHRTITQPPYGFFLASSELEYSYIPITIYTIMTSFQIYIAFA